VWLSHDFNFVLADIWDTRDSDSCRGCLALDFGFDRKLALWYEVTIFKTQIWTGANAPI